MAKQLSDCGETIKTAYESEADTNAFTDAEKTKLASISSGAQVNAVDSVNGQTGNVVLSTSNISEGSNKYNVQSDWNSVSGLSQILNKPSLFSGVYNDLSGKPPVVVSDPTGITGADALTNMVSLTQAEYDAIVSKSATTLYVITDA